MKLKGAQIIIQTLIEQGVTDQPGQTFIPGLEFFKIRCLTGDPVFLNA